MPIPRCFSRTFTSGQSSAGVGDALASSLLVLLIPGALGAQIASNGGEFQVNTYTSNPQEVPSVAADGQGRFVVAWESYGSGGSDTSSSSIHAQRLDSHGAPLGGEVQVNGFTGDDQRQPAVASDALGRYVVVWESIGSTGSDGSGKSVQARRFAADGAPLGDEFQVNSFSTNYQERPAVAMDSAGNFVVVWQSVGSSGGDSSAGSIQAQRFDANGIAVGGEFQVNSFTTNIQGAPAVAIDGFGRVVVVWHSIGSVGNDVSENSIQAQRYDTDGTTLGGQFQVNSYTTSYQFSPAVAADDAGGFVVVWGSTGSAGTDTSSASIQAQRYDAAGAPEGSQFQVNATTTDNQHQPAVFAHDSGEFVVVWQSESSAGTDASAYSVQVQRFRADGSPDGGERQVNSFTIDHQGSPSIAADSQGNFIVVWESSGSSGTDTSSASVQAQRFDALFRDGFESNDTLRWSATLP